MKLKDLKDKFDRREIAPSADSWQRLSKQLDQADKKKKRPLMYWICAAAAIAVVALMISQTTLFSTVDPPVDNSFTTLDRQSQSTEGENEETVITKEQQVVTDTQPSTEIRMAQPSQATSVASHLDDASDIFNDTTTDAGKITIKPVLVDIDTMKRNKINNLTLVQETDLLLKEAFAKAEPLPTVAQSIEPDQLLRETEWDIEADRRNRLNNSLKNGFGILKVEAFALIGVDR